MPPEDHSPEGDWCWICQLRHAMLRSTDHSVESASSIFGLGLGVDVRGSGIADFVCFGEGDGHGGEAEEDRVT